MSLKIRHSLNGEMAIDAKVPNQLVFNNDGTVSVAQRSDWDVANRDTAVATLADIYDQSTPRFSAQVWTGKATAIPDGYIESSGQQVLDLMYPDMREDVIASQFYCTEVEWQADPYKRVTHWSLGDGDASSGSWMRCPDKNGVQAGNVGAFYGTGSDPAGGSTGTAVTDASREFGTRMLFRTFGVETNPLGNIVGIGGGADHLNGIARAYYANTPDNPGSVWTQSVGTQTVTNTRLVTIIDLKASNQLPVAGHFRPLTWYGVWILRMYGRVTNTGTLDASALNVRMDEVDSRVSVLEGAAGQPSITGVATLTGTNNEIEISGLITGLRLDKGDVVEVIASPIGYNKLHTVESLINAGKICVNYEHCGARGNGSLKLPDYTGQVTIKRIAKWYNAAEGLGQEWVELTGVRGKNIVNTNNTGRAIFVSVVGPNSTSTAYIRLTLLIDGATISGFDLPIANKMYSLSAPVPSGKNYVIEAAGNANISIWMERR